MPTLLTIPRTFGGTLLIIPPIPSVPAYTQVTATGRDGRVVGKGRDGRVVGKGRDGTTSGKGR